MIEGRGAIETAKRVKGYVVAVLKRAHAEGRISADSVRSVELIGAALKPAMPVMRLPALTTVSELADLQLAVDRSTAGSMTKLASRLLALTVPRAGFLRQAVWSEFEGIDWDNIEAPSSYAIWRIPAHRMKLDMGDKLQPEFGHDVPLSRQAIDVLRAVRTLTGRFEYVFTHGRSWRDPMTDASLSALYKRLGNGRFKNRMVPHGWRTAFSTILNERAAELERPGDRLLIDIALAHIPEGMSASEWAYNRARYLKPRATLYQVWADIIAQGLPSPDRLLRQGAACPFETLQNTQGLVI
nr:site-specific integrase [Sphingobium sp. AP50]